MNVPSKYAALDDQILIERIHGAQQELGDALTILGHHYQRDESIQFADVRGDSLGLSRQAAATDADFIVFCGVYFMAETAAILCDASQIVVQPVAEAVCPMARMANRYQVAQCWEVLNEAWPGDLLPITYQNSIAEVKAFVGEHGGAVCTSSNAADLFEWAFEQVDHVLFVPDEHLGTNTALEMGIPEEEIAVWDPTRPIEPEALADARVVVWQGFCSVHTHFCVSHVEAARQRYPEAQIIVHPECPHPVVERADMAGSTAGILRFVDEAPPGSTIIVGTEWHFVNRLNEEYPDKTVLPLDRSICQAMAATRMPHILYVLDSLVAGNPVNVVNVPDEISKGARLALNRMLEAS